MPAAAHQRNPSSAGSSAPPVPISITICGDGGCGKSSITLRLVRSQWVSEYDPTIEDSYSLTRRIDGVTYHLSLTDTAGQEEYRGMWASSNLGADAFLLVYDITSPDSLHALQYFTDLIDMEAEIRLDNAERARRAGLPLGGAHGLGGASAKVVPPIKMVAGNKCDLAEGREVSAAQGLEWARRHGCAFMETSARLEVNIEETFRIIVRRVVEARRQAEMTGGRGSSSGLDGAEEEDGRPEPWDRDGNGIRTREKRKRRGPTKPLTPLPIDDEDELEEGGGGGGGGGRRRGGLRLRGPKLPQTRRTGDEGGEGFWRQMRCW